MGYYADGKTIQSTFNPNVLMTIAELATTLSRLLRGELFKGSEQWRYHNHLLAIQKASLMSKVITPTQFITKRDILTILLQL
ncbi:MAG: hypothetical protein LBD75_06260 [Candidatus Peribacteria bacterium]|jgi:hypothetical protein|nr:hypothetical protein [Candidatus Peribacteria bacterium]